MKANCSTCHRPIRFVESMIGERTICPHCRGETQLPTDFRQIELEDIDWQHRAATSLPPVQRQSSPPDFQYPQATNTMPVRSSSPRPASARPTPLHSAMGGPSYGPGGFECPFCHTRMLPYESKRISTAGWVVFVVLLVVFFPLFWIGLLMNEPVRKCSGCGHQLG